MDYTMPRADDLPSFKVGTTETPCPCNPLGIKGCGEAGAIASPPAVINAITDAIGNEDIAMPATPQRSGALRRSDAVRGGMKSEWWTRLPAVLRPHSGRINHVLLQLSPPQSVADACQLAKADDAKSLAGGMTLIPAMKPRLASPSALVDLGSQGPEGIKVRAVARHRRDDHARRCRQVEIVQQACPASPTWPLIGDPAVRNRGTIGGSIANNDPAADYPAACLALGATIVTNKRKIPADKFFTGLFETALKEGEIVAGVLPDPGARRPTPSSATRPRATRSSACSWPSAARTSASPSPAPATNGVFRATEIEAALKKRFSPKSLDGMNGAGDRPQRRHPRLARNTAPI